MKKLNSRWIMALFCVFFALAYGTGKSPVYSRILGLIPGAGNLMQMTVEASGPEAYPESTTNLVSGSWDRIAHSMDGEADFVVTNLNYAGQAGSDYVIYVNGEEEARFFRLNAD